jgi:hypothetical protein
MRRQCAALCAAFLILAFALPAWGGIELITIERPFHARSLAGFVIDATGAPIPGVVVEECDASFSPRPIIDSAGKPVPRVMLRDCDQDPKHILASTTTDANGHFAFPEAKKAAAHYLHLSSSGFDPMQVIVKVSRLARSAPHIQMHIAT